MIHSIPYLSNFTLLLLFLCICPCQSTHFRYGQVTWEQKPGGNGRIVRFTVDVAWRASFFLIHDDSGEGKIFWAGSVHVDYENAGDTLPFVFTVTSVNSREDWLIGVAVFEYEYAKDGQYIAVINGCCRISSIRNNPDSSFAVTSRVNVQQNKKTYSMKAAFIPIQHIALNSFSEFKIPVFSGTHPVIRYKIAGNEALWYGTYQPISGLLVDPISGIISWTPTEPGLYTIQIAINGFDEEDDLSIGLPKSYISLDFLINVVGDTGTKCKSFCANSGSLCTEDYDCYDCYDPFPTLGEAPFCIHNVPPEFSSVIQDGVSYAPQSITSLFTIYGTPTQLIIYATDADTEDIVSISYTTPPASAVMTRNDGNPASIQMDWTPIDEVTDSIMCFTAADSLGAVSNGQFCITLNLGKSNLRAEGIGLTYAVAGESTQVSIFNAPGRLNDLYISGNGISLSAKVTEGPQISKIEQEYFAVYNGGIPDLTTAGFYTIVISDVTPSIIPDPPLTFFLQVVPSQTDPPSALIFEAEGSIGLSGGKEGDSINFFIQSRDLFGNNVQEQGDDRYYVKVIENFASFSGLSEDGDFTANYIGTGRFNLSYIVPTNPGLGDTTFGLSVFHENTQSGEITFVKNITDIDLVSTDFDAVLFLEEFYVAGSPITAIVELKAQTSEEKDVFVTLLGITSNATFQGSNTYTFSGTPILKAGTYTKAIIVNAVGIRTRLEKNLVIVPGPPNATNSLIEYEETDAGAGEAAEVFVIVRDSFDNIIRGSTDEVEFQFFIRNTSITGDGEFQEATSKFKITFSSNIVGVGRLEVYLKSSGQLVSGRPVIFEIQPGSFSFSKSLISRPLQYIAGKPFKIIIEAFDNFGNRREAKSDIFDYSVVSLSPSSGFDVSSSINLIADENIARYTLETRTSLAGYSEISLSVRVLDGSGTNNGTFQLLSSFLIFVSESELDLSKSIAVGKGLDGGDALSRARIFIQAADRYGNAIRQKGDHEFVLLVEHEEETLLYVANYSDPSSPGFCGFDESLSSSSLEIQVLSANGFWFFDYEIPLISRIGAANYNLSIIYTTSRQLNEHGDIPSNSSMLTSSIAASVSYASGDGSSNGFIYIALSVFFGILLLSVAGYSAFRMYRYRAKYKRERARAVSMIETLNNMTTETALFGDDAGAVGGATVSKNPLHPLNQGMVTCN